MSAIRHFQTYSQRENHVTNNTLLMLRHVYRKSPLRFERVLHGLLGDVQVEVGPQFAQQRRGTHSVPDGVIEQRAFDIHIEAKHGGLLDEGQLQAHLKSIAADRPAKGSTFLLGLVSQQLPDNEFVAVYRSAKACGVVFRITTYEELLANLTTECSGDAELMEIQEDYRTFIGDEGLLPDQYRKLVAFPCGASWLENVRFGVYYEPDDRNPKWAQAHLIGIYHDKQISHIGRLRSAAICRHADGKLEVLAEEFPPGDTAHLDDAGRRRIEGAIEGAEAYFPGFAEDPHRFYVVDRFVETGLIKVSPGGMMRHRYFDVTAGFQVEAQPAKDIDAIAQELRGKTFE